jgi:S-adenosylmethionine:tRNA ribosyltransferase-isomerase
LRAKRSLWGDFAEALLHIENFMNTNGLETLTFPTEIIIVPGYKIKSATSIITNFHQPKSTLLLLIAALVGDDWKKIYRHALEKKYRFLSYGDSSLLKFG